MQNDCAERTSHRIKHQTGCGGGCGGGGTVASLRFAIFGTRSSNQWKKLHLAFCNFPGGNWCDWCGEMNLLCFLRIKGSCTGGNGLVG